MSAQGVVAQLVEHLHGMQGVVGSSPISSTSMADVAQLVRALVCGTRCRRFESGYPPHFNKKHQPFGWCFLLNRSYIHRIRTAVRLRVSVASA